MRILVLANFDVGLHNFRKELLKNLIDDGNEVYISLPYGELVEPLKKMGCIFIETHLSRRGRNPAKDILLFFQYMKIIGKIKPDKIITYTIKPNIYGGWAARLRKIPLYSNITGLGTAFQKNDRIAKIVVIMYKIALKKAKTVFFENVDNKDTFISRGIIKQQQVCLLNGAGVNLDEYKLCEYPEDGKIHFLFVGRVMKEKGIDELLYVAQKMHSENKNVCFDIVGPFEDDYKTTIQNLNDKGVINYYGFQEMVKPFVEKAHCFVLPSYHEGMANTLLENGAMGRPLITSNIHGCKEAVVDEESGYLCRVKDKEDLYDKINKFYELPYEDKKEMGIKSYIHISGVFDKKKVVKKTVSCIYAKPYIKNILFLTLLDFESIDEKNLYTDLLRQFVKNGHNIHVLSPIEKRNGGTTHIIEQKNCKILKFKIGNMQKTNLIEKGMSMLLVEGWFKNAIKKYFNDVKYDMVLYATPPITLVNVVKYIKKRDGATSYLMLKDIFPQNAVDLGMFSKHGPIHTYFRFKEKKLYKISDYIGCMSQANVDYLLKNNKIPSEKVGICPNSAELVSYSLNASEKQDIRGKYNIPIDSKVFVYGGNLGKPQCIDFIIECVKKCCDIKDVFFLVVGAGTEYQKIYDYYKTSGQSNLKVMSYIPKQEFDELLTACDVGMIFLDKRFTIPNFPSRILSYMQAQLPVLAVTDKNTDVGKIAVDNGFGWWMESADSDEFRKMVDICKLSDTKAMGKIAREYLVQNYTVEKVYNIITEAF